VVLVQGPNFLAAETLTHHPFLAIGRLY